MPTKTEQSDLLQAMFGRNGESPVAVVAPASPADCFDMALQACRLAVRAMTPVFILSEGFLANSAEPWLLPDADQIDAIKVSHPSRHNGGETPLLPFARDARIAGATVGHSRHARSGASTRWVEQSAGDRQRFL